MLKIPFRPSVKLRDVLAIYLQVNTRATAKSTLNHYSVTLSQWQDICGTTLKSLTDDNLAKFMRHMKENGRAIPTVNQKRNYICAFWRWCCKRGYVRRWPTVPAFVEPERVPEAYTREQLERLLTTCRRQPGFIDGVPASDYWYAIHLFWYFHGERATATLNARWCDFDGVMLTIPAELRKGGQKGMVYELVPVVIEAVESIRLPEREQIWPWPLDKSMFYHRYKLIIKAAGLPYERWKSGPHKMRRTYASHLKASGGNPTESLRHSKAEITQKSYLDPRIAKERNQSVLLPVVVAERQELDKGGRYAI